MNTEIGNKTEIDKENDLIDEVMRKGAYFRNTNRLNYHKRKEAGTLKKKPSQKQSEYIYKHKNIKDVPTIDDIVKLKYIKPKQKLVKIDELEYEKYLNYKKLN